MSEWKSGGSYFTINKILARDLVNVECPKTEKSCTQVCMAWFWIDDVSGFCTKYGHFPFTIDTSNE